MSRVTKAVFPIAGLGSRFLPATKAMPKVMLPVVDKPLIQYAVDEALAAGIEEIIFVTGRGKGAVEDHFDHDYELVETLKSRGRDEELATVAATELEPGQVVYVRQPEPMGLGHAVYCARYLVGSQPFAVLLADDLILGDGPELASLLEVHERRGGNVVAVQEVPNESTDRYGILDPAEDDGRVVFARTVVEKPEPALAPSRLAIVGRYVLDPDIFAELARMERGAGAEVQLTDAIAHLTLAGTPLSGVRLAGARFDCGTREGLLEATLFTALHHPEMGPETRDIIRRLTGS